MTQQAELERLRERLGGIEIEQFNGDNFAVWLCSQFDDPDDETEDECGWGPTATERYEAVVAAIHAHYAPTIERLSAERLQLREALEFLLENPDDPEARGAAVGALASCRESA